MKSINTENTRLMTLEEIEVERASYLPEEKMEFNKKVIITDPNKAFINYFYFTKVNDDEIWLKIEKQKIYIYNWTKYNGDIFKGVSLEIGNQYPLYRQNNTRNRDMVKQLTQKYSIKTDQIHKFLNKLGLFLQEKEEKLFKEEFKDESITEKDPNDYGGIEDYPLQVQEEALKILEGDVIENCLEVINLIHTGDINAKKLILLSAGTLFLPNARPVHQGIKGTTGSGKTSLTRKTLRIVPSRFIQDMRDVSPKYVYYASPYFNPEYNIFIFDDIQQSETNTELLKTLTDNETKNKTLKTVIEQKPAELQIPGKTLAFCTVAKDITSIELDRRLLYNNPQEDKNHSIQAKQMITDNAIAGIDINSEKINYLYSVLNAVFEKLIESNIQVYTPYLHLMGFENKNNTDIEHFINLVKAVTFFNQFQREKIGKNVILGTYDDYMYAKELWDSIESMQRYKIDAKQTEFLNYLPEFDQDIVDQLLESYQDNKNDFHDSKNYTTSYYAKKLNQPSSTIKNYVYGRFDSDKMSLEELGLIKRVKLEPDIRTSPVLIFATEKTKTSIRAPNQDLPLVSLVSSNRNYPKLSINHQRSILRTYMKVVPLASDTSESIPLIDQFLKIHSEDIKSDLGMYKFLESFKKFLKYEKDGNEVEKGLSYDQIIKGVTSCYNYHPQLNIENIQNKKQSDKKPFYTNETTGTMGKSGKEDHTNNIILTCSKLFKNNGKGLDMYIFRDKLRDSLKNTDEIIIREYEDLLIDNGYIELDSVSRVIKPTPQLLKKLDKA